MQGAFDGGAVEVVVNDSHGTMDNHSSGTGPEASRDASGPPVRVRRSWPADDPSVPSRAQDTVRS
ncbi:M55 family metallopeptidase [Nonomuraea sediminis]|uniref:M55 family metallopeptidase n=1 Tax=Nonomuraea sediminis TaxID=2835864 RepID=UPI001BDCC68D